MDKDLESYGVRVEKSSLTDSKSGIFLAKLIGYCAVLLTMLAFIFSCIGLSSASQSSLEKTLYNFAFPYFDQIPAIAPGIVVSLDSRGYAFTGAGTTISREVTSNVIDAADRTDVRTIAYDKNLIFTASVGELLAFEISEDDIPLNQQRFPLPAVNGEARIVETLMMVGEHTLMIVGHGELLTAYVNSKLENGKMTVTVNIAEKGFTVSENGKKSYLKCDDLFGGPHQGDMMACSWEEADNNVYTNIIRMRGEGDKMTFTMDKKMTANFGIRRRFHGLAGLGPNGYVVAASGALYNDTERKFGPISYRGVFVMGNRLIMSNLTFLSWEMSDGFFTFDNMGPNNIVLCYPKLSSEGITCTTLSFNGETQSIVAGASVNVNKGGAASADYSRIKMQIQTRSTFAVLWADANIGGSVVLQQVTMTDNEDLVKTGPAWVISQRGGGPRKIARHIIGICGIDWWKSAIIEMVREEGSEKVVAHLHTMYVYPRPIGIAGKSFTGGNEIQFGGIYRNKNANYTVGAMYYTNDRGMILRGPPAGYAHRDFGVFYVQSRSDNSLLALSNQVGMAVSKTEILLKLR